MMIMGTTASERLKDLLTSFMREVWSNGARNT